MSGSHQLYIFTSLVLLSSCFSHLVVDFSNSNVNHRASIHDKRTKMHHCEHYIRSVVFKGHLLFALHSTATRDVML